MQIDKLDSVEDTKGNNGDRGKLYMYCISNVTWVYEVVVMPGFKTMVNGRTNF